MSTSSNNAHELIKELPPSAGLELVLTALARELPQAFDVLVAAEELAAGRDALNQLSQAGACARVAARLSDTEARWMSDRLLHAWQRISVPTFGCIACVSAPSEIWVGDSNVTVLIEVFCLGLAQGWQTLWPESMPLVKLEDDQGKASLVVSAPEGKAPTIHNISVRVVGHALSSGEEKGDRQLLLADTELQVRRPFVTIHADGLSLLVRDQSGTNSAETRVQLNNEELITDAHGIVALNEVCQAKPSIHVGGAQVPLGNIILEEDDGTR